MKRCEVGETIKHYLVNTWDGKKPAYITKRDNNKILRKLNEKENKND